MRKKKQHKDDSCNFMRLSIEEKDIHYLKRPLARVLLKDFELPVTMYARNHAQLKNTLSWYLEEGGIKLVPLEGYYVQVVEEMHLPPPVPQRDSLELEICKHVFLNVDPHSSMYYQKIAREHELKQRGDLYLYETSTANVLMPKQVYVAMQAHDWSAHEEKFQEMMKTETPRAYPKNYRVF